jgi:hypothetical protein
VPLRGAPSEDKDHALRPSLLWKENVHRLCLVRFATPRTLHKLPGAFFNRSRSPQAQGGPPPTGWSRSIKKVAGRQRSSEQVAIIFSGELRSSIHRLINPCNGPIEWVLYKIRVLGGEVGFYVNANKFVLKKLLCEPPHFFFFGGGGRYLITLLIQLQYLY